MIGQKLQCLARVASQKSVATMAWRSHGHSNDSLVDALKANGLVEHVRVEAAMRKTDRGKFAPHNPYEDCPQSIGHSATISAPHMHANCLELLEKNLYEGATALDLGSGSGYLAAAFAYMVGKGGKVVGVEHIPELTEMSIKNCNNLDPSLLSGQLKFLTGDGRLGHAADGPYDAIHVGAAAERVPQALLDQLKNGGRMIIPVGPVNGNQMLEQYDKDMNGKIHRTSLYGVRYVPFTDKSAYS
eukprot:m.24780 g.24780  ORF g.24780 m.24780 type:complete len:243 (-) comp7644_c0_seq2:169-897(-)